jgi:hypothetical protein
MERLKLYAAAPAAIAYGIYSFLPVRHTVNQPDFSTLT